MSEALGYALAAAFANVLGAVAVTRQAARSLRLIEGFVAFGAGFMLAVVLVEILPHAFSRSGASAPMLVLLGYFLVHFTQHAFTEHFHFGEETHDVGPLVGASALVGLLLHTFFDGVAIASGFLVQPSLGILIFLAILFHKLPEGVTISSIFLAGGQSPRRAVGSAALLGLATVLGVVATEYIEGLARHGLAIAGGVTLYVAASDLVPEFQSKSGWRLPAVFFLGAAVFFAADRLLVFLGS